MVGELCLKAAKEEDGVGALPPDTTKSQNTTLGSSSLLLRGSGCRPLSAEPSFLTYVGNFGERYNGP